MRGLPWTVFLVAELAAALGLAPWYGVRYGDCAPPSIYCFLGGVACSLLCENAWAQFPEVMLLGGVLGLLPALGMSLAAYALQRNAARTIGG